MKRILVAATCLITFALAAEASINRNSPEAAVKAAYAADETALVGHGAGVMGDNTLRARFFSRSLLRSIAADEVMGGASSAGHSRAVQRRGAPPGGAQGRADLGDRRPGESAGRVRPGRRRAREADLRHGVRTGRVAHQRHCLHSAGWPIPHAEGGACGELSASDCVARRETKGREEIEIKDAS